MIHTKNCNWKREDGGRVQKARAAGVFGIVDEGNHGETMFCINTTMCLCLGLEISFLYCCYYTNILHFGTPVQEGFQVFRSR